MCHQSVSLTARELEQQGIATIIIGSAMDIVTHCSVPRYLHNNLPLGNPLGPPYDIATQERTVRKALNIVSESEAPCVIESDVSWPDGDNWQSVYNRVDDSNRAELERLGEENRAKRAADKRQGLRR